jgi:hypothetical protein
VLPLYSRSPSQIFLFPSKKTLRTESAITTSSRVKLLGSTITPFQLGYVPSKTPVGLIVLAASFKLFLWCGHQIRQQHRGSLMAQIQMAEWDRPMDGPPPDDTRWWITTWMNCWYYCRRDGALLDAIWILEVGAVKTVAGGEVLPKREKLITT